MERKRVRNNAALVWVVLVGFVSQNLVMPVMCRSLEAAAGGDQKNSNSNTVQHWNTPRRNTPRSHPKDPQCKTPSHGSGGGHGGSHGGGRGGGGGGGSHGGGRGGGGGGGGSHGGGRGGGGGGGGSHGGGRGGGGGGGGSHGGGRGGGGGGGGSHGGGRGGGGGGGSYDPTPLTPPSPAFNPVTPSIPPPTPTFNPVTPSIPPPTPTYDPAPVTPSITPPTPTYNPAPTVPDPNIQPSYPGTCYFWGTHPALIWGLFGFWGTMGGIFGTACTSAFGSNLSLHQALLNTRNDGIGSLYREGTASLLNSMATTNFPYTAQQVKEHFMAALVSDKAAAAQAQLFKKANEGHLKL